MRLNSNLFLSGAGSVDFLKTSGSKSSEIENSANRNFKETNDVFISSEQGTDESVLNEGFSKYRYKGSDFNFYKKGEKIKGEYITPEGIDAQDAINEFYEKYSSLSLTSSVVLTSTDNGVNGTIDEATVQGSTGDCWILTAINALNSNETGKEIIENSLTVNDDGSVTVEFKGIGVSYTITAEEIEKYDTDDNLEDSYSNGDNDMLVLELAVEKLWEDINSGKVTLDTDNESLTYTGEGNGIDDGGLADQMIYYLTGIESEEYFSNNLQKGLSKNEIYNILSEAYENSDTTVLTFGIYYGVHSAKLTDGTTYTLDVGDGGHALSVTEITEDTVTFVNPWDSSVSYTMSWEEFANLGVGFISYTDLSDLSSTDTSDDDILVDDTADDTTVDSETEDDTESDDTIIDNLDDTNREDYFDDYEINYKDDFMPQFNEHIKGFSDDMRNFDLNRFAFNKFDISGFNINKFDKNNFNFGIHENENLNENIYNMPKRFSR